MVLNLQFWEKDKAQAMALARLIADLEEKPRNDVTFLFSARFDCEHDEDTISYVAARFPVLRYTTQRKATGWPHGPNEMMADSYEHLVLLKRRKGMEHLSSVLFMEADCVPLHRDWINLIKKEYDGCGKKVLGAWLMKGADCQVEHVNGNCVVSFCQAQHLPSLFGATTSSANPIIHGEVMISYGRPNATQVRTIPYTERTYFPPTCTE